jgi:hypothetical protein
MLDATTRPYIIKAVCHDTFPFNASYCRHINEHPVVESFIQRKSASYLIYYRVINGHCYYSTFAKYSLHRGTNQYQWYSKFTIGNTCHIK